MTLNKTITFGVLFLTVTCFTSQLEGAPLAPISELAWLAGQWHGKNGEAEAEVYYATPKAGMMLGYYLLPATMADFYRRLGDREKAANCYHEALPLSATEPEKRFLFRRLKELETKT